MSKRVDKELLQDILDAISRIKEYVKDLDLEGFRADRRTIDAVTRNLEIIGVAANRTSDISKKANPDVEWLKIIGLRNRIVHAYFDVDDVLLWEIVERELDELERNILHMRERSWTCRLNFGTMGLPSCVQFINLLN